MGYACPVCEVPQRDAEHLANHLAFTAMLRGDEHESWLDEHAPDWGGMRPADLGPIAAEHAEEAQYDEVFEDTTERTPDHDHDHADSAAPVDAAPDGEPFGDPGGRTGPSSVPPVDDAEMRRILSEARDLTERMRADDASEDDGGEGDPEESSDASDRPSSPDESEDGTDGT